MDYKNMALTVQLLTSPSNRAFKNPNSLKGLKNPNYISILETDGPHIFWTHLSSRQILCSRYQNTPAYFVVWGKLRTRYVVKRNWEQLIPKEKVKHWPHCIRSQENNINSSHYVLFSLYFLPSSLVWNNS